MISKKIGEQGFYFTFISGIGWIIDFSFYSYLVYLMNVNVGYANYFSAIPAITFVFFTSTQRIFKKKLSKLPIRTKYLIYIFYQLILLTLMSYINSILYESLISLAYVNSVHITSYMKIASKIIITPVTLILNFLMMRIIVEKI